LTCAHHSIALAPGELVKDPFFTLFESVAALEVCWPDYIAIMAVLISISLQIMDPKMDSGCVDAGEEFEETYDVSRSLSPQEVIGIMDELLCHEVSGVPPVHDPRLMISRCRGTWATPCRKRF
jgi:N-alpha-acetyltransferase 35, NatC auxiliary subunit